VQLPRAEARAELLGRGFDFRDTPQREILSAILARAASLLASVRGLEAAIDAAVDEIVLLRARPAFDVSHSEPRWPSTIFVSVPTRSCEVSALRALENIIHEAMHLRLTAAECADPLVADMSAKMASPWRQEHRSLQGVLHGVYVFRSIAAFYAAPTLAILLEPQGLDYIDKRRAGIGQELACIDSDRLAAGLTPRGRSLLDALGK
jgi:HEXXH motif-containing protein